MSDKEFWDKDMTTVHDKHSWFTAMSGKRRLLFILMLVFVAAWCFLLGFQVVESQQPDYDEIIKVTAADLEDLEPEPTLVELTGSRVILVMGSDSRGSHTANLSDTMMLVFMDMDDRSVDILSIPRDTYAEIPGKWNAKINEANSLGGIELAVETVELLTGISIDNYAIIDFQGFVECVDIIGGIELEVDERMYKPSENIDLQPGLQTLNGEQALGFVRYRGYVNGDLGRIEHQQYFISQLADQVLTLSNLTKLPALIQVAKEYLTTDMKLTDIISIATYMIQMDMTDVQTYTVPCEAKWMQYGGVWASFVFIQEEQFNAMLREITDGELEFTTHVLDDGGKARYSLPSDEPEPSDTAQETVPPAVTDPSTIDPSVTDPGVTDPGVTDPGVTDPGVTDPGVTDPGVTDPGVTDPGVTDPGVTDPGAIDQGSQIQEGDGWDIPEPN